MHEVDSKNLHPRLLLVIVAREVEKAAVELLRLCHIPVHYQSLAEGTASSEFLDVLGLEDDEKILLLSMAPKYRADALLRRMDSHSKLSAPGMGVAFSLPLSGISRPDIGLLDQETRERMLRHMEHAIEKSTAEVDYSLVLVIANQGYSDDIVHTAKEAGAGGGTVLHARRVGMEDAMKVWGISIQEEREVLLIGIQRTHKAALLRAIATKHGITTPAHAIAVSMPVDGVAGLDKEEPEED